MPIVIRPVGARGGPRGMAEQDKAMSLSDAARNRIARAMEKAAKDAAPSGTRLSDQDLMIALKALRQKKKSGGKVKKAKGMKRGGKMKAKGMAKGGKRGGAKKMRYGGKSKAKGMNRGGKMMKAKGMKRGGKAKR